MGRNQYWAGRVYDLCVYCMTGTPEGSTESGFMWKKYIFLWPCSLAVPVLARWVCGFVVLCPGTPEGSTGSGSGFKASQKTGQRF